MNSPDEDSMRFQESCIPELADLGGGLHGSGIVLGRFAPCAEDPPQGDSDEHLEFGGSPPLSKPPWPHAPVYRLTETGVYMVTAGTYRKQRLFHDGPPLRMLHHALLTVAEKYAWRLEAWAVFPNHYHFIAVAPEDAGTLVIFLRELHSRTAVALNRHDAAPGRKIWHND